MSGTNLESSASAAITNVDGQAVSSTAPIPVADEINLSGDLDNIQDPSQVLVWFLITPEGKASYVSTITAKPDESGHWETGEPISLDDIGAGSIVNVTALVSDKPISETTYSSDDIREAKFHASRPVQLRLVQDSISDSDGIGIDQIGWGTPARENVPPSDDLLSATGWVLNRPAGEQVYLAVRYVDDGDSWHVVRIPATLQNSNDQDVTWKVTNLELSSLEISQRSRLQACAVLLPDSPPQGIVSLADLLDLSNSRVSVPVDLYSATGAKDELGISKCLVTCDGLKRQATVNGSQRILLTGSIFNKPRESLLWIVSSTYGDFWQQNASTIAISGNKWKAQLTIPSHAKSTIRYGIIVSRESLVGRSLRATEMQSESDAWAIFAPQTQPARESADQQRDAAVGVTWDEDNNNIQYDPNFALSGSVDHELGKGESVWLARRAPFGYRWETIGPLQVTDLGWTITRDDWDNGSPSASEVPVGQYEIAAFVSQNVPPRWCDKLWWQGNALGSTQPVSIVVSSNPFEVFVFRILPSDALERIWLIWLLIILVIAVPLSQLVKSIRGHRKQDGLEDKSMKPGTFRKQLGMTLLVVSVIGLAKYYSFYANLVGQTLKVNEQEAGGLAFWLILVSAAAGISLHWAVEKLMFEAAWIQNSVTQAILRVCVALPIFLWAMQGVLYSGNFNNHAAGFLIGTCASMIETIIFFIIIECLADDDRVFHRGSTSRVAEDPI